MSDPAVSVVIPTYNRERFIGSAVRSIVVQTFADWELIVVDDGSTDSTVECVAAIGDPRVRIVRLTSNCGIAAARNRGLEEARGRYIAWLDSDDVAKPDRLARQVNFLSRNADVALVGGCAHKIAQNGLRSPGTRVPPFRHEDIRCRQLLTSAFQQSSIMGHAAILKAHAYDPFFEVCEDIDVCVRIARNHRLANIPAVLVDRRMHDTQVSREQKHKVLGAQVRLSRPQLEQLGMTVGEDELIRLCALARTPASPPSNDDLRWAETALKALLAANAKCGLFQQAALRMFAGILMFDRYRRYSPGRAFGALATSPFAADLVSSSSVAWLTAALPVIASRPSTK
jgi:hypothetical protein